jgi:hypothetical protein
MKNSKAVNKIIMFGFNYPNGFIYSVWHAEPNLAKHLQSKFNLAYDKVGSAGVFNAFYVNLDSQNQTILINWILANYKG